MNQPDPHRITRSEPPEAPPMDPGLRPLAPDTSDDATLMPPRGRDNSRPLPVAVPATAAERAPTLNAANALPAGTRLEEFELQGVIGEGGFGIVYRAWDHLLRRPVAVKEYMPSTLAGRGATAQVQVRAERWRETFDKGLDSFVNEARTLARFDHPSLLKVYRFWTANGTAYMAMPLYQGITWKARLQQLRDAGEAPTEAWLLSLLGPLTEALALLHEHHTYHRDIAPDNVLLLEGSGQPVLLDFGAARSVIGDATQDLTVILKPGYAPVEQYAEVPGLQQGPWTDVYALAASVHFALLGKVPPASVSRWIQDGYSPLATQADERLKACSPGFLAAIDQALRVKPEARMASMAAFRQSLGLPALAAAAGPQATTQTNTPVPSGQRPAPGPTTMPGPVGMPGTATTAATAPAPSPAPVPAGGRRTALLAGAALLGLGGAAGGWWLMRGGGGPAPTATAPVPAAVVATPSAAPAPAAAPASTTDSPPAAAPFAVSAEFRRVLDGQTPQFTVRAAARKNPLRIGQDQLAFSVTSNREGYVQVLTLGPDGTLWLLFPNTASSNNRIQAGQTLNLPQAQWALDVAEPAGTERFLVIVSSHPRDHSALSQEREYLFLKLPTGDRGRALRDSWPLRTPWLLGKASGCTAAAVGCDEYGATTFEVEIVR